MSEIKPKCQLCLIKVADQTGSHITSAFLLKSQIGKRGQEKAYIISSDPLQNYKENRGDKDIKEDFIICRDCERRLSFLEGLYATEIAQKIEVLQFSQNFIRTNVKEGLHCLESLRLHPMVIQLLLQSNIWRAAISTQQTYDHFNPSDKLKETMRKNLDVCLPPYYDIKQGLSPNEWNKETENLKDEFTVVNLLILRAENLANNTVTYDYIDSESTNPYEIIINEYVLFLFENSSEWTDDFFEFRGEIPLEELLIRSPQVSKIGIISNERYSMLINKIQELALIQRREKASEQCIRNLILTRKPFGQKEINECVERLTKGFT